MVYSQMTALRDGDETPWPVDLNLHALDLNLHALKQVSEHNHGPSSFTFT